jgi:hypothetical protein
MLLARSGQNKSDPLTRIEMKRLIYFHLYIIMLAIIRHKDQELQNYSAIRNGILHISVK